MWTVKTPQDLLILFLFKKDHQRLQKQGATWYNQRIERGWPSTFRPSAECPGIKRGASGKRGCRNWKPALAEETQRETRGKSLAHRNWSTGVLHILYCMALRAVSLRHMLCKHVHMASTERVGSTTPSGSTGSSQKLINPLCVES